MMKINLFEVADEGKNYKYSNETAEVTAALSDLIGNNVYETDFFIRPLNSKDFELKGWIKTKSKEICSYCGVGIQFPVYVKFHEILIPPQEMPRDGKYSKPNHFTETETTGPDCVEYQDQMKFDIGEYLHETIALSIPFNPAPELNSKGECTDCGQNVSHLLQLFSAPVTETPGEANPFSVLKDLKIQK
jgi:uncharacterized protein